MPLANSLDKTLEFFQKLASLSPSERVIYLNTISKKELRYITELFNNFLHRKLKTNILTIARVRPYKTLVRKVGRKLTSVRVKRKLLNSPRGGFILNILIPAAITLLSSLIK